MEDRFQNKYRISSPRLSGWDYGSHGVYFVTICTKDRVPYFGDIEAGTQLETRSIASLQMTELGRQAYDNWVSIPEYHPYIELDEFVIMPNHIHGILFINKPTVDNWQPNKFGAQSKNLASIIRGYKSSVTQYARVSDIAFEWQPRYHDRIIRSQKEHDAVIGYIYDNPDNWLQGKDNLQNLPDM